MFAFGRPRLAKAGWSSRTTRRCLVQPAIGEVSGHDPSGSHAVLLEAPRTYGSITVAGW
jgi:hypothetical protein